MGQEFAEKLEKLRQLMAMKERDDEDDDELCELSDYVLEHSNVSNALERETAESMIRYRQEGALVGSGGYPIRCEKSFEVDRARYTVIAFGCSAENDGKDALDGMVFVREV